MDEQAQRAYEEGYRRATTEFNEAMESRRTSELAGCFKDLQMEMRAQGVANSVRKFGGESSLCFTEWCRDMERARQIVQGDDERMRGLTLHTLTDSCADFCSRLIEENVNITWEELKKALEERYSDQADLQYARLTLRKKKQKKDESVQTFYEELISTAKEAYRGQNLQDRWIQATLIEIFIEGVLDSKLAKRLIRRNPTTLEEALKVASDEIQAEKSFQLRRGSDTRRSEAPMEIDNVNEPAVPAALQQLMTQLLTATTALKQCAEQQARPKIDHGRAGALAAASQLRPPTAYQGRPQVSATPYQSRTRDPSGWTTEGKPICFGCRGIGHMKRECPSTPSKN